MSSSSALYETDSAELVFVQGIKQIMRVFVDDIVGDQASNAMKALDNHQDTVLALKKSQRASSLSAAYFNRAQMHTERELRLYSQRRILSLTTARKKGEKTPEYRYAFKSKTPHRLLPKDPLERREELDDFVLRAQNVKAAGTTAFSELGALVDAIKAEKLAQDELKRATAATEEAARVEKNARIATVVSIRAMNKNVQSFFADEPGMARRILGHGDPVATRRRNARLAAAAEAEKLAKEEAAAAKLAADAAIEAAVAKATEPTSTVSHTTAPGADAPLEVAGLAAEPPIVPATETGTEDGVGAGDGDGTNGLQTAEEPPAAPRAPETTLPN